MTIEIDDAGTGDLVGDAFIGFLRKETGDNRPHLSGGRTYTPQIAGY